MLCSEDIIVNSKKIIMHSMTWGSGLWFYLWFVFIFDVCVATCNKS